MTAPILYAIEEFPQLGEVVDRGFDDPADVDLVSIITNSQFSFHPKLFHILDIQKFPKTNTQILDNFHC